MSLKKSLIFFLLPAILSIFIHAVLLASSGVMIVRSSDSKFLNYANQNRPQDSPVEDRERISSEQFLAENILDLPGGTSRKEKTHQPESYKLINRQRVGQEHSSIDFSKQKEVVAKKLFKPDASKLEIFYDKADLKLLPPEFSSSTIPEKPALDMNGEVENNQQAYVQGDIFKDSEPLTYDYKNLEERENAFKQELLKDLEDGAMDMPFSRFIIFAEYFQLSRALFEMGLQPHFTVEQALEKFDLRLKNIAESSPDTPTLQSLIIMLQHYSENKFYPRDGSGMLLDSLFHNLNDCEGGSKELLAYLDAVYPDLTLGSVRGLLPTTGGDVVGHMQAYIFPGPQSRQILNNDAGIVLESTWINNESISPYAAGDIYPLEDFIYRYYPELTHSSAISDKINQFEADEALSKKRVGVGTHPLKMDYGASSKFLSAKPYDLAGIMTQQIQNEFMQSSIDVCDPNINPGAITSLNIFSNFVYIDGKLREKLITHYLADLAYWDNMIMPQWKRINGIPTYDNLAKTIMTEKLSPEKKIRIDAENFSKLDLFAEHKVFLEYLEQVPGKKQDNYLETGGKECEVSDFISSDLITFLFKQASAPGLYFLPAMPNDFPWHGLMENILNDCIKIPEIDDGGAVHGLEELALKDGSSLRKELYLQAISRGGDWPVAEESLARRKKALLSVFTGRPEDETGREFSQRRSVKSSSSYASVSESISKLGKTGISIELLQDLYDFFGPDEFIALFREYCQRKDLDLSIARAYEMVRSASNLALQSRNDDLLSELLAIYNQAEHDSLKLALGRILYKHGRLEPEQVFFDIAAYLKNTKISPPQAVNLLTLGLNSKEASHFNKLSIRIILNSPDKLKESMFSETDMDILLFDHYLAGRYLKDSESIKETFQGMKSLLADEFKLKNGHNISGILNELYILNLIKNENKDNFSLAETEEKDFLRSFVKFSENNPLGKMMISMLFGIYGPGEFSELFQVFVGEHSARFQHISENISSELIEKKLRETAGLIGEANIITHMLYLMPAEFNEKIPVTIFKGVTQQEKAFAYLAEIHGKIAQMRFFDFNDQIYSSINPSQKSDKQGEIAKLLFDSFYLQDAVRQSFSLLGFLAEGDEKEKVHFRKISSLKEIIEKLKDLKISEASGSRNLTVQDMSLLTLSLNSQNHPEKISKSYGEIIDVTEGLFKVKGLKNRQNQYFFAPHDPYLTKDNSGFLYSPDAISDIRNAHEWGPKNEILLKSYLYFKNMPEILPDWLLKAAVWRSDYEMKRIKALEQQSFLGMIQECESDFENIPRGFFNAKWLLRRPYGEDAFPGTLLLLRMGYLKFTNDGELVKSEKMSFFK